MACKCLSRHLEDVLIALEDRRDEYWPWQFIKRRRLRQRQASVLDVLQAVYRSER